MTFGKHACTNSDVKFLSMLDMFTAFLFSFDKITNAKRTRGTLLKTH